MAIRKPLLAALFAASLGACSHGYRASGRLEGSTAPLAGEAYLQTGGGARFTLHAADGGLMCDGIADPSPTPSSAPGCPGEGGNGRIRCSDRSEFPFAWTALSCRAFTGTGVDGNGRRLEFTVQRRDN